MKHLRLLFLAAFITVASSASAQKIGDAYLPPLSDNTPQWFSVFYQNNYLASLNVYQLDEAAEKYKEEVSRQHSKTETDELLTGEEHEDVYLLYYFRWRKAMDKYVKDDGTIQLSDPAENSTYNPSATVRMSANAWTLLGPRETFFKYSDNNAQPPATWQVNIYGFAVAPSNTDILYAAPETGGLFKTTDNGMHWTSLMDTLNPGTFFAVAIHPTNPDIVYAGGTGKVYKSTDGGVNFTTVTVASSTINNIIISPSNPNLLFIASNNGVFTSSNAGVSWALVTNMSTATFDLAFNASNDSILYALKRVGTFIEFWKSTDAGASFNASINGWSGKGIAQASAARFTVTPADPNRIYAVLLGSSTSPLKPFVFRSNDGGANWDTTCTGTIGTLQGTTDSPLGMSNGQGYYDLDIVANNLNADEVIVASTTAYRSVDGGLTFTALGGYRGPLSLHPDIQEMVSTPNGTWIATDGGMNHSTYFFDSAATHTSRNNGIYGSDCWGLGQGWNEDLVAGGRYHNGNTVLYENYTPGNSLRLGGGEAGTGYYMMGRNRSVVFSDLDPGVVIPHDFNGSTSSFAFNKLPNEDGYGWDASEVEFFPYCYNHIYSGNGNELWKSTDGGNSWISIHNFNQRVKKFEVSRSNPDVIYLATASSLYKTTDGGANWAIVALPGGTSINRLKISVAYDDENKVWLTSPNNSTNNRVFKSVDGGTSWINLTTPAISPQAYIFSCTQEGTDGGIYIIANGGKVFYRNNTMTDWADYSTSLPRGFDPIKMIPFYRDSKLRAAGNRGVWEIPFFENSAPLAQPTVDKITSTCTRDTFYFDDFSVLNHLGATWNWTISPAPSYISADTVRNPKVVFNTLGSYSVTLTVTNAMGTSSKTVNNMIQITGNDCSPDTVAGKMLVLTNVGDYASQTNPMNINTNTLTISCWIKPDTIQNSYAGIVFSGSGGACGMNFKNNNQIGYHWEGAPATYNWAGGPTIPAHQWSHLALVITPTDATIYLNGKAYNTPNTHNAVTFNEVFQFGKDRGYTNRNFRGAMDEVCFYNRALSQNEIRELMNLTRNNPNTGSMPLADASLIAYYQFNEGGGIPVYDKVGINHLNLDGGATKTTASSAPVGGGIMQRLPITSSGVTNFTSPNVQIECPLPAPFPNGDVVVTRLNVPSDQPPSNYILPNNPHSYYVIRNYGTNSSFSPLSSITFNNVQGTNNTLVSHPNYLKLYMRPMNADSATWGTPLDSADVVSNGGGTGSVKFSTDLNLSTFGQFTIANTDPIYNSVTSLSPATDVGIYPNPSNGWISIAINTVANGKKGSITVFNLLSQVVKTVSLTDVKNKSVYHINIPTAGVYYISLAFDGEPTITRKVVVE